ncbi:bifunctional adenosylcobinamide kinase/adenosylcobinamide-phosphate guanylyltransferase [Nocardioides marmorisolisilvae]|uniref:Adenosylcobinamide kinase n=1 Tax=Nocardioides marmorisolisilvae TaxID=1542737 RepID=A0A3N0DJE8_9ACTN|nr:bifunctional adenosylcobinamide kinase/adenosylcobinamide-phosphate guanylyltransferase [Nocardioides marmorisolisilvae]RNL75363.1 bifunctional adenosylcobinamide kinase/adenosylcobinamide-phosphate guanylyltransferase [Nocardioides marmorisolisilvae]
MRVLVTGGVRSGKSAHAEGLLADRPAVTYVAAGPVPGPDDTEWAARVALHRDRRPAHWSTVESTDLPAVLGGENALLVDCLGTWLTAQLDDLGWEADGLASRIDALTDAVATCEDIVLVTNEVGAGVVPEHRSGRLFRDQLGVVNQRIAAVCDEVHLVVAGRVLVL